MRAPTAEHPGEQLLEMPIHRLEHLKEAFTPLTIETADRAAQPGNGRREVFTFLVDGRDLLLDRLRLGFGAQIDRPHLVPFLHQTIEASARLGLRPQR